MAKIVKTCDKAEVVAMIASGCTQKEVGNHFGVSQQAISNLVQKNKAVIDQLALDLISDNHQYIRDSYRLTFEKANKLLKSGSKKALQENSVILGLADKKESRLMKVMGITPSQQSSTVINMLFAAQGAVTPQQHAGYREFIKWKGEQDVMEAEVVETEESPTQKDGE